MKQYIKWCIWSLVLICCGSLHADEEIGGARRDSVRYRKAKMDLADSFKVDSLRKELRAPFLIRLPKKVEPKEKDPFSPFNHEDYYRQTMGKMWFLLVSLVLVVMLIYYRELFGTQFLQRLRSLASRHDFEELLESMKSAISGGSIVAGLFSTGVMAQLVVLGVSYMGYIRLNHVFFYLFVWILLLVLRVGLYALQNLQTAVFDLTNVTRTHIQRQLNVDLAFAVVMFPLVNMAYFNAYRLIGIDMGMTCLVSLVVWVGVRITYEFFGLLRDGEYNMQSILYFCAFEILPHLILVTALLRAYQ